MKPANEGPRDARDTDAPAGPDTRPTSPPTESRRVIDSPAPNDAKPSDAKPGAAAPSSRVPPTASVRDWTSVDVPVSPDVVPAAPRTHPSGGSDLAAPHAPREAARQTAEAPAPIARPDLAVSDSPNDRGTTMQSRMSPFARAADTAWESRSSSDPDDATLDVNTTQRSPNSDLRAAPIVRDDGRTALLEERVDALEVRLRLAEKTAANERWRVTVALVIAALAITLAASVLF